MLFSKCCILILLVISSKSYQIETNNLISELNKIINVQQDLNQQNQYQQVQYPMYQQQQYQQQNNEIIKNMSSDLEQLFPSQNIANHLKNKMKNIQQDQQQQQCGCAKNVRCPNCDDANDIMTQEKINNECQCHSIQCENCNQITKNIRYVHENAANQAQQYANQEEELAKQSELQAKLFILAQKYAKEQFQEEEKAKRLTISLQESTSRAQINRNKMLRAVYQAKQLAKKSYEFNRWDQLLTNYNPNLNTNNYNNNQIFNPNNIPNNNNNNHIQSKSDLQS